MPIKQRLAAHYRAAAAHGRNLLMRAKTPWLREHLGEQIARCERMAEEIERAAEPARKAGKNREIPLIANWYAWDERNPTPDQPSEASAARRAAPTWAIG